MNTLPGIGGNLFPERYLADQLVADAATCWAATTDISATQRRMRAWWQMVDSNCGPASGIRTLFDLVAMPLCALLDFQAERAVFDGQTCRAALTTRAGSTVALLLLPWASHPSSRLRDVALAAQAIGAGWGFVLAPPFLSIVQTRGQASRRAVDFDLSSVIASRSAIAFLILARARAFDPTTPRDDDCVKRGIEVLLEHAAAYQSAVRRDLQEGVELALGDLCRSVVSVQGRSLRSSPTDPQNLQGLRRARDQALTLVYRILFLLFAESRDLVPHRNDVYRGAYAMGTLCRDALEGSERGLWDGLAATTRLARLGCRSETLTVRPFNGPLFARSAAPALERRRRPARPASQDLQRAELVRRALVALGSRPGRGGREAISFKDLGVEQLGAIYESILDLDSPGAPAAEGRNRGHRHSRARRQTGTFYTPQALTEYLVRRTLDPLVSRASSDGILALRVVDPAMGSGAFLVAACRYLSARYEQALLDEGRAAATDFDEAERAQIRRTVAERCLAGVDRNPTAVHLARLSLWLTTLARDKPLTFLDHRLRSGDSLVGAWPDDLERLSPRSRRPRGALPLLDPFDIEPAMRRSTRPLVEMLQRPDESVADVRAKEAAWRVLAGPKAPLAPWRAALDLWCARWFWPGPSSAPDPSEARALLAALVRGDRSLPAAHVAARMRTVAETAQSRGFFHWSLEFADVFYDEHGQPRPAAGFDAVLGNPPWEMLRADGDEAESSPAASDGRQRLLHFVRECGAYPSCDRGHLNLYQPFVERALALVRPGGRVGLVVPWGLAADDGAAGLRRRLLDEAALDTVIGFENVHGLFPIHRSMRFAAVIATSGARTRETRTVAGIRTPDQIDALETNASADASETPLLITPDQISAISGPMRRLPAVRHARDLDWLERAARCAPRLGARDGWHVTFGRELNATEAGPDFSDRGLPIVEGKHLAPFRVDLSDALRRIDPSLAARHLPSRPFERPRLAYRDVSGVTNRHTLIAAVLPAGVVTTHTVFCLKPSMPLDRQRFLCALLNSYVLNAMARMLMGGHLTTTLVEALPAPRWGSGPVFPLIARLGGRLEKGPPSPLAEARVQALVARLYELTRTDFGRILETFPLVPAAARERAALMFERDAGLAGSRCDELIG